MDRCCQYTLIFYLAVFGCICAAGYQYGTISVVGPAFVNREVTLKATPLFPWGCDVEWKYTTDGGTTFQTMNGQNIKIYLEDGSFFLKWTASIEYNKSAFYAGCSTNTTIRTRMVSLNMIASSHVLIKRHRIGLGHYHVQRKTYNKRTWKKTHHKIQLRKRSDREGRNSVIPSYPVLGPKTSDFNTTKCIYVYKGSDFYCKTENRTEPVQLFLLLEHKSFAHVESEGDKGLYRIHNVTHQMAGLSRRNVTCQVSNAALQTPDEVNGILCNVEEGSPPVLTVPEFLDGESSTTLCEVRGAIPAPLIEIRVGNVFLSDIQLSDSFNGSSHTFTSTATVTKTNKVWNGKEMCCDRKHKDDFDLKDVSVCKNISIKYPPSNLSMSLNRTHEYSNNFSVCFLNMSCETDESNPPCLIEWSSDIDNLRYVDKNNWTDGENGSYRSFSSVRYSVTEDMAGGSITCSTKCVHFPSVLDKNYNVSFSGGQTLYLNMTSPVALHPNITVIVKCFVDDLNNSEQWTLWWEDENNTVIKTCNKTEECLLTLNYTEDGDKTYICNTWKSNELLRNSLTVSSSRTDGSQTNVNDTQTFPSTFRFPVNDVLIGTGVFCGLCIMSVIGRCVFLKRRKVNEIHTIEIVENHSDTSSDNGVLHIATAGVQYAVVQRQAAPQRIETQQSHDDDSLTYAELDIEFLQEANAKVPPRRKNTPTEYADIEFFLTQESAVDDPVYHNTSASDQNI